MRQETRRAVVAPARERSVPPLPTPSAPPSPTLFRTALVVFTLVVSGLFVGTGLYDALVDNGTEGRRAAAAVAGVLVVVGLAFAVLLVEPVVIRHRLRLTPAGRPHSPALWAVAELGAAEGTRVHGVLVGPATQQRPFVVGRPGDYRIVLPPALARLEDPALFRTLVRHELIALRRRDVAQAWLAGSLRYVVGPLLAVPVVVELAHGAPQAAAERIGHSVLLVAVLLLALGAWRAARRPAVLSGADGLALGFLAALALPLSIGVAAPLSPTQAVLVGALVVGPAFGATAYCGLRQALAGPPGRPTRSVTFGVLVGGLVAVPSSLGPGFGLPMLSLVAVPVALAGATAFIGGLAALWVRDPSGCEVPARRTAALCGAVATAALLWMAQEAQLVLQDGSAALVAAWLAAPVTLLLPGMAAVLLAAADAPGPRGGRGPRPERPRHDAVLLGLFGGVGGGLGLVGYRLVVGPPANPADVFHLYVATVVGAALVGAVSVALLALARGVAGIGAGLLAGPLATVTTGLVALAVNAQQSGNLLATAWPLLAAAVSAGFALSAPAALVGLLRAPRLRARTP